MGTFVLPRFDDFSQYTAGDVVGDEWVGSSSHCIPYLRLDNWLLIYTVNMFYLQMKIFLYPISSHHYCDQQKIQKFQAPFFLAIHEGDTLVKGAYREIFESLMMILISSFIRS